MEVAFLLAAVMSVMVGEMAVALVVAVVAAQEVTQEMVVMDRLAHLAEMALLEVVVAAAVAEETLLVVMALLPGAEVEFLYGDRALMELVEFHNHT